MLNMLMGIVKFYWRGTKETAIENDARWNKAPNLNLVYTSEQQTKVAEYLLDRVAESFCLCSCF